MDAKSAPFQFQLPRVLCIQERFHLDFPSRVFGVSLFSAKALYHGDTGLQLDRLLALVSTIALHGKTRL